MSTPRAKSKKRHPDAAAADPVTAPAAAAHAGAAVAAVEPSARHRGTVLTVGVAVVIAALFLAAQLAIMRHKRKEELARATGGYHFPVEINFPPEEP